MHLSTAAAPNVPLTLAIPTFNRAGPLKRLLDNLAGQPGIEQVHVLVSDNGSTDDTREVIATFQGRLTIDLVGFELNHGFDQNYVNCVRHACGRHVWVMGDDDALVPGAVTRVLAELDRHDPDLIVCNGGDVRAGVLVARLRGLNDSLDTPAALLDAVGWHLCWIGTCVTRRSLLDIGALQASDFNAFVHIPLLLRSLPKTLRVARINEIILHTIVNNSDYFRSPVSLVRTFGEKLHDTLAALGPVADASRLRFHIVRAFHAHLHMFGWRSVLAYRKAGLLSAREFAVNLKYFQRVNPYALAMLPLFLIPPAMLQLTSLIRRALKTT